VTSKQGVLNMNKFEIETKLEEVRNAKSFVIVTDDNYKVKTCYSDIFNNKSTEYLIIGEAPHQINIPYSSVDLIQVVD
jgi:hypothetical protein